MSILIFELTIATITLCTIVMGLIKMSKIYKSLDKMPDSIIRSDKPKVIIGGSFIVSSLILFLISCTVLWGTFIFYIFILISETLAISIILYFEEELHDLIDK